VRMDSDGACHLRCLKVLLGAACGVALVAGQERASQSESESYDASWGRVPGQGIVPLEYVNAQKYAPDVTVDSAYSDEEDSILTNLSFAIVLALLLCCVATAISRAKNGQLPPAAAAAMAWLPRPLKPFAARLLGPTTAVEAQKKNDDTLEAVEMQEVVTPRDQQDRSAADYPDMEGGVSNMEGGVRETAVAVPAAESTMGESSEHTVDHDGVSL